MEGTATIALPAAESGGFGEELLSLAVGAAFTLGLFLAIAGFETADPAPALEIEDLRVMSVPMEAPPPRPVETTPAEESAAPIAGIEIGASDSDVKIAVVPPDLTQFIPAPPVAAAAAIQPTRLYTEFKPRTDISAGVQRIFQPNEVDQKPFVLSRPTPNVPPVVRGGSPTLRISLLIVVNAKGEVDSVRVLQPSGNRHFDSIIIDDVRHAWIFSPAIKRGQKVKCMIQQTVRVNWTKASPFES